MHPGGFQTHRSSAEKCNFKILSAAHTRHPKRSRPCVSCSAGHKSRSEVILPPPQSVGAPVGQRIGNHPYHPVGRCSIPGSQAERHPDCPCPGSRSCPSCWSCPRWAWWRWSPPCSRPCPPGAWTPPRWGRRWWWPPRCRPCPCSGRTSTTWWCPADMERVHGGRGQVVKGRNCGSFYTPVYRQKNKAKGGFLRHTI